MTAAARAILAAWLAATLLEAAARAALTLLAMARAGRRAGELPAQLRGQFDPEERERAVSYTLARGRLSLAAGAARTALLLAAVLGGLPGVLDRLARSVPAHPRLQGALFVASLFILSQLAGLPVRLYSTFVAETRSGFNRTTAALAGTPVLLGLFARMDRGGCCGGCGRSSSPRCSRSSLPGCTRP